MLKTPAAVDSGEPVAPVRSTTRSPSSGIRQPMAAGEVLFGLSGFTPLVRTGAVGTIMPDVKHCGGFLEMTRIAAVAAEEGVMVAPHNPSGPISTAASAQVCAVVSNENVLELQYGEVAWRSECVRPQERFAGGTIQIPDRPGLGVTLNAAAVRERALPL